MVLISSCASTEIPVLNSPETTTKITEQACLAPYAKSEIQFVHGLDITLPGNDTIAVIGVTTLNPAQREFESVLMTIEGLVIFHAKESPEGRQIIRKVDAFDSEALVDGLMRDIQLIFLMPDGNLEAVGSHNTAQSVCRFRMSDKSTIDIVNPASPDWKIIQYSSSGAITKSITTSRSASEDIVHHGFPGQMTLKGHGVMGYSIDMKLIQVNQD